MRFLTFNLWHGLSPTSPVMLEALEPSGRRTLREALQFEVLAEVKPDICFFQEVNPAASKSAALAKHLGMSAQFQPDLVGLKLFGIGLPFNLNSGLVTMAGSRFGLRWVDAVPLSRPGFNLVRSWGSWQLKEERFALFTETLIPRWGRVLLINTHLHHGLESTPDLLAQIDGLAKDLDLSESMILELRDRLFKGNQRRAQELAALLRNLERCQKRYETVVLAGDLNASPDSELSQMLRDLKFRDAWAEAHPEGGGLSFDKAKNEANHLLQSRFPLSLVLEDLSFSTKIREALLSLARKQEYRPRRIDYIWFRSNSVDLKVSSAQLIGFPNKKRGWRRPIILVYAPISRLFNPEVIMGPIERVLREKLASILAPSVLEIVNESPQHGLPAEAEKHFRVVVASESFETLSRLERHRRVHEIVAEELRTHVHALSVQAFTPAEWREKQGSTFASPKCLGGGKHER